MFSSRPCHLQSKQASVSCYTQFFHKDHRPVKMMSELLSVELPGKVVVQLPENFAEN